MDGLKKEVLKKPYKLLCALALLLCVCKEIPEHCGNYVLIDPNTGRCESEDPIAEGSGTEGPSTHFVTWNTNGGEPLLWEITVNHGDSITAPSMTITKADSGFGGWYIDSDFTTLAVFPITVTEDKTLYAKYMPPPADNTKYTLTISYNSVGGTVTVDGVQYTGPVDVTSGKTVNISAETSQGYRFDGWGLQGGAVISNASANATTVTLSANATVNAKFTEIVESTFTDTRNGGKTYKIVKIGGKWWMGENLNHDTASGDGSWCYGQGGQVFDGKENDTLTSSQIQANCRKYGRLYTWNVANTACPRGWHLPSSAEWQTLVDSAGGSAGKKLRAKSGWNSYDGKTISGNGTDVFGFSALPGGRRMVRSFYDAGGGGYWWTATEGGSGLASDRYMDYNYNDNVGENYNDKLDGYSVRCIADD